MNSKYFWKYVLLMSLAAAPSNAFAQSVDGDSSTVQSSGVEEDRRLDRVTVTAQRRTEASVDVPIALAAVSGDQLQESGVTDVASLQLIVPGLSMGFAGANAQPSIRGVGTQVAAHGLPSNVATYVDGIYRPNQVTTNIDFANIESVTVLKGPQGALYGRNATGGAILIETKGPSFDPGAVARLTYRSYNDLIFDGFATGPLSDKVAASVSLYQRESDGYVDNILTGEEIGGVSMTAARAKLLFQPSDKFSVNLTYEYTDTDNPNPFIFSNYNGWSVGALFPGAVVSSKPHRVSTDYPSKFKNQSDGVILGVDWDFDNFKLTSISGAVWQEDQRQFDTDGSSAAVQHITFPAEEDTYTNETFLTSTGGGRLQWTTGISLYKDTAVAKPLTVVSLTPPIVFAYGEITDESAAIYADLTYQLTDKLFITGGARYSTDDVSADIFAFPAYAKQTADKSFDDLSPRFVVRYAVADNTNVYASYNQGYKTGGFNLYGGSTGLVRPEEIEAFEVGVKTERSGLRFDAAAFAYDYTDLQVSAFEGNASTLVNAASAKIYGAEGQLSADLTSQLQLNLGLSYTDAEYDNFPDAPHYQWSPTQGVLIFPDDASGNQIPNSPKFSGTVSLNYTQPLAGGTLDLRSAYAYRDEVVYDPFSEARQPSYGVLDLRAQWTTASGNWTFGAFANNATDEEYVQTIIPQATSFAANYAPPTIIGIDITFRAGQ